MDPITFLLVEIEARRVTALEVPDHEDYKDAIVNVFMDEEHLTDEDIDRYYEIFSEYKRQSAGVAGQIDDILSKLPGGYFGNFPRT